LAFAETANKVCLCGALAGEILAIPDEMHIEVKNFMQSHQLWLEGVLRTGKKNGQLQFTETPARLARTIFSAPAGCIAG